MSVEAKEKRKTLESAEVLDDFGSATVAMHLDLQDDGGGGVVFVLLVVAILLLLQHIQRLTK